MLKRQHNRSVLIVAATVSMLVVLRLSSLFISERTGAVDPRINLQDNKISQITERQRQQQMTAFAAVADGEVSRTEQRIREATALAVAAGIYAASESLNRQVPTTVGTLLLGANSAGLMPPQMKLTTTEGEVRSGNAQLIVRFRRDPLGIEVLSFGKSPLDGPALFVRVGGNEFARTNSQSADLYIATTLDHIFMPSPFANEAEIVSLGFTPEPFRAAKLPTQ